MDSEKLSLSERKQRLIDEMMAADAGGFTGSAPAEGPVAGYDPVMGKDIKRRKKKKEVKEETLDEARDGKSAKDKGYTLRDWFKGGGWKQTGGKYDGKPCAKQPGQTTKPFCRDADDRASMDKDERNRRAAKKRREDPDADRSGAAKNVSEEKKCWPGYEKKGTKKMFGKTYNNCVKKEEAEVQETEIQEGSKDACYHKVKSRYKIWPSAYASGALVKCRKKGAANWCNSKKKD